MEGTEEKILKKYLVGTCTTMCPKKEMLLREKEKLLHKFEIESGTENDKLPKADPGKVVKCYSRSAAGREIISSDLRPFSVLSKTIRYLYHDIFPIHKENPKLVYDFMFDRLRSIRQDMIVQNLNVCESIEILEPIVRFHIYFGYFFLCENEINFSASINSTHLQECLKSLLLCYDECERETKETDQCSSFRNRSDFESAYLLLNLSHFEALTRGAKLVNKFITHELFNISLSWYLKNYVRVFKSFHKLPPLLLCIAAIHIPHIRKYSLQTLSHAFSCKNCLYPISKLKEVLMYENEEEVLQDCHHFNIKVSGEHVVFIKTNFNAHAQTQNLKRLSWVDGKLSDCDLGWGICTSAPYINNRNELVETDEGWEIGVESCWKTVGGLHELFKASPGEQERSISVLKQEWGKHFWAY